MTYRSSNPPRISIIGGTGDPETLSRKEEDLSRHRRDVHIRSIEMLLDTIRAHKDLFDFSPYIMERYERYYSDMCQFASWLENIIREDTAAKHNVDIAYALNAIEEIRKWYPKMRKSYREWIDKEYADWSSARAKDYEMTNGKFQEFDRHLTRIQENRESTSLSDVEKRNHEDRLLADMAQAMGTEVERRTRMQIGWKSELEFERHMIEQANEGLHRALQEMEAPILRIVGRNKL